MSECSFRKYDEDYWWCDTHLHGLKPRGPGSDAIDMCSAAQLKDAEDWRAIEQLRADNAEAKLQRTRLLCQEHAWTFDVGEHANDMLSFVEVAEILKALDGEHYE